MSAACSLLDGRAELGPDGFWRHAITTASAASVIAGKVGLSTADAFSAGLLHDLGAVLLHRRDADAFEVATAAPTVSDQVAAELAAFGVTHADEGATALDAWGFPEPFVEAVAMHQHGVEEPKHALGRVLRVAEAVALEHSPMPGYPATPDVDRLLLAIRLRPDDFDTVTREVDAQLERIADLLGVEAMNDSRRDLRAPRLDPGPQPGAAAGSRAGSRAARRAARGRVPARAGEDRDDARRPDELPAARGRRRGADVSGARSVGDRCGVGRRPDRGARRRSSRSGELRTGDSPLSRSCTTT